MERPLNALASEEVVIEAASANKRALLLMFPIAVLLATPYWLLWEHKFTIDYVTTWAHAAKDAGVWSTIVVFLIMVTGIISHELIHGIVWGFFCRKGIRSIRFGILWRELTPYCHCLEPLSVHQYRIGAIMPAVVLGIVPTIAAYITSDLGLLIFGIFFSAAAAGDFMIIHMLRDELSNSLVLDHPKKIGYIIYRDKTAV